MKRPELLAPCGNMDCLKAAVEAGCDAVYLAGTLFGARSFAGNFTNEEIKEAIEYCHLYGVKVYITVNTIIYEREVERFIDFIRYIHKANVDAVIIQDIGMLDLVRKKFPNLEVHASTQMHIHNYDGALFAKKMGIKRVVMARETPYELIKKIKEELSLDVEIFVHGALCVSYSGECLMSALIGNRSGNRGTCAQVCRKMYDLYDLDNNKLNSDKYLLSTKDLCLINDLDKLIDIGVDSLKIEGRMKRPEYVYLVVSMYRNAIDNYINEGKLNITEDDIINLKKMFNRNFTKGFIFNEDNNNYVYQKRPNHKGIDLGTVIEYKNNYLTIKLINDLNLHDGLRIIDEKEDKGLVVNKMFIDKKEVSHAKKGDIVSIKFDKFVKLGSKVVLTSDFNQLNIIEKSIKEQTRKVLIDVNISAKLNEKLYINVTDGKNKVNVESDFIITKALNKPIDKDFIIKQINKTGSTVYKVNKLNVILDDNIFINIKDINELRRKALELLNEKRLYKIPFIEEEYNILIPDVKEENYNSLEIYDNEHIKNNYDIIYTENTDLINDNILPKIPRVIIKYPNYNRRVLIGEVGGLLKYKEFDTDFSFNVVNSYSVAFLHSMGAKKITLSYELTLQQMKLIVDNYKERYNSNPNLEVIINSYPEAMISKFDLNKMYDVKESILKDEFVNKYKIISFDNFMKIYHFEKVNLYDTKMLNEIGILNTRVIDI